MTGKVREKSEYFVGTLFLGFGISAASLLLMHTNFCLFTAPVPTAYNMPNNICSLQIVGLNFSNTQPCVLKYFIISGTMN